MEFTLFFLALALFWKMSSSLQCFRCAPEETYTGELRCSYFNGTEIFLVLCEHSTMCYKKETTLLLSNGRTSTSTERGCASQRLSGDQARINGKWQFVNTIYEVYEEGCKEAPTATDGPIKTVHCFCRGDQCNSSSYHVVNFNFVILVTFMYFFR